jgi:hypothetical protein
MLRAEHWNYKSHGINSAQNVISRSVLWVCDDLLGDLCRYASQGLPLCGGQGRVICRRSCDWLPKTAAADDGASAARLGAPQHVDIHSLASDGVKLLEIEHKLEIHIVTCGVGG